MKLLMENNNIIILLIITILIYYLINTNLWSKNNIKYVTFSELLEFNIKLYFKSHIFIKCALIFFLICYILQIINSVCVYMYIVNIYGGPP